LQESPEPAIYVPYNMATVPGATFLLKTDVDPLSIVRAARERARSVAGDLPVTEIRTLEEYLSRFERAYPRFSMTLFSIFAVIALLLASVGLYAVVAHSVSQRTREIGLRMAVGGTSRDIVRLVFVQSIRQVMFGLAVGLLAAFAVTRVLRSVLVGVSPNDPATFLAVAVVLMLTGVLACAIPARRATRVDPVVALRCE
jgi:ABC-type antimicrobial peptide transport system permease subunit